VTDTTTLDAAEQVAEKPRRSGALSAMRLAELQGLASSMGIAGTATMRKGDLVAAIKARQSGTAPASAPVSAPNGAAPAVSAPPAADLRQSREEAGLRDTREAAPREDREISGPAPEQRQEPRGGDGGQRENREGRSNRGERDSRGERDNRERDNRERDNRERDNRDNRGERDNRDNRGDRDNRGERDNRENRSGPDDDGDGRGGRRRNRNRNRGRDKRRGRGGDVGDYEAETQVADDDVLVPVAGILDVLDNYAFVRTSGYLPGSNDVYVPLGVVKKNGLRKGDAVTGAVKAQREDQQQSSRQKFNALVRLDTVNGTSPDDAGKRLEFGKLTPLYPQQRLRLETEANVLTTRVIDLVAPIGKGQRGLIVAPAKAGKTMVMQAIANAITTNNPECHLMVVLVDERPEEVTDMQRAVKGEVISSTFDRPADDHTTVAELAIERAKRLVEMGHDVVVLLDSITKLGRAYNLAAPASGRILSGGVDSAALYPPKKFFGAARNIEDGGSLTILATALVETGSRMDEVIFEEFKGTGNMELKLDRGLANRRIFPAVDVNNSGTRKEEILLSGEELKIMWKLRRVLAALDQQQGIELLIDRLKKTKSNVEFLMQVQQTSSIRLDDEDSA
jgi:transcription termination factor Rho